RPSWLASRLPTRGRPPFDCLVRPYSFLGRLRQRRINDNNAHVLLATCAAANYLRLPLKVGSGFTDRSPEWLCCVYARCVHPYQDKDAVWHVQLMHVAVYQLGLNRIPCFWIVGKFDL